jgi:hypothetical protein
LSLVTAIARVPRDASDKPLKPVMIRHVKIVRAGEAPKKAAANPAQPATKK